VIDDDVELCELLAKYLAVEGFTVEAVHDGAGGVERAATGVYSLIVLDVMLPLVNGLDVLRRIRSQSPLPVLMLTAKGDATDRVVGLELGADDYLPKPFDPRELVARIRAILRRGTGRQASAAAIAVDDLELDPGARVVRRRGVVVEVTTVEFELLEALMRSAGQVVSRETLTREVLGREFSPFDRAIDTHVYNLRRKLGPQPDGKDRIKGVRGIGYQYARSGAPEHGRA
jgi:DNA-binding response OmpR family regulator